MWDIVKWTVGGLLGLLGVLVGVIWSVDRSTNAEKHKEHARRMDKLNGEIVEVKLRAITDDTLNEVKAEWRALLIELRFDFDRKHEERRQDIKDKHEENRNTLLEIKRTIDDNEKRDSATRHDLREAVHVIALQMAKLNTSDR